MSCLGIDLWDKRVWIAVSHQDIAFAHSVVERTKLIRFLKKYLPEHEDTTRIVVGLPYDLYDLDHRQLDKTKKFIKKLENLFPMMTVVGHDERFSSFEAHEIWWGHRDDIAAQCILQSYIDSDAK